MVDTVVNRRAATPADAVCAVPAGEVVSPPDVEGVVAALRDAAGAGSTVVPVGGGSKLGWAAPPRSVDVRLELGGLDRVVEHSAGDLVVVAEAGVRLADLQHHVGRAGQWLALDPPETGATLGGVVSANASGPRRLRYGTARDLLIGVTVVLADGTVASAGGKVVKNVAGYDLAKLYTGAHGTLGVVVSTTWRLHPVLPARRVVAVDVPDPATLAPMAAALGRSALTPTAVEATGPAGGPLRLTVVFESIAASVEAQAAATVALLGQGTVGEDLPAGFGERPAAGGGIAVRMAFAPAAVAAALDALPPGAEVRASACSGVAYAALPGGAEGLAALARLREGLGAHDGTAVVIAAPDALRAEVDHWGPVGDAAGLMRRVKDRFDPQGLLAPGRFVEGI